MLRSMSRLRLRLLIVFISLLIIGILYILNVNNIIVVALSVAVLSVLLLLATTPVIQVMKLAGVVIVISCLWLGTTELMLQVLKMNCLFVTCDEIKNSTRDDIANYAQFLQKLYPDDEWRDAFSLELAEMMKRFERTQYYPYTGSRAIPFIGDYAFIDEQGLRLVPQSECSVDNAYRVFVFGNSAMFGVYEPNESMLAALIQEQLQQHIDEPVCLINLAQGRWNSTQSLIQLINLIQQNDLPDLVIFYEGATDVLATSNYQRANIPLATDFMARRIGATVAPFSPDQNLELWLRNTAILQQFSQSFKIPNQYPDPEVTYIEPYYLNAPMSQDEQVNETVTVYLTNYEITSSLGQQYGFDVVFVVQPVSFYGEKELTPKEQIDIDDGWPGKVHQDLYQQIYEVLKDEAEQRPNLSFLGNIFDGITDEVYGDPLHVLPNGNTLIAAEIGSIIEQILQTQ